MFGVLTTYKFKKPLTEDQIAEIKEKAINPATREPGFRHHFAISAAAGELGSFHTWDSRQQAEAAMAKTGPVLQPLIHDLLQEPPVRIMSEVVAEHHA